MVFPMVVTGDWAVLAASTGGASVVGEVEPSDGMAWAQSAERLELRHDELEEVLGGRLPAMARRYPYTFWSNGNPSRARRWISAGLLGPAADDHQTPLNPTPHCSSYLRF